MRSILSFLVLRSVDQTNINTTQVYGEIEVAVEEEIEVALEEDIVIPLETSDIEIELEPEVVVEVISE